MVKLARRLERRRSERGTSVVEAAFVMPLLLLLVFTIGDFGIAYTRWNTLTNAVREGARAGVVFRTPCNVGAVETQITTTISDFADLAGLDGSSIVPTINGTCNGTGTPLTVTATIQYDYIGLSALSSLPFFGGGGVGPTLNLSARTVMRNE